MEIGQSPSRISDKGAFEITLSETVLANMIISFGDLKLNYSFLPAILGFAVNFTISIDTFIVFTNIKGVHC